MEKKLKNVLLIGLLLLLVTSCRNNAQAQREIETFFATLFFVFIMFIGGIPAIVFSALNIKSEKTAIKVLAIVFTSILGLFSMFSFPVYIDLWGHGTRNWITMLCVIQYGGLLGCVIMLIVKASGSAATQSQIVQNQPVNPSPKKPSNPAQNSEEDDLSYLDKFLDDDFDEE